MVEVNEVVELVELVAESDYIYTLYVQTKFALVSQYQ